MEYFAYSGFFMKFLFNRVEKLIRQISRQIETYFLGDSHGVEISSSLKSRTTICFVEDDETPVYTRACARDDIVIVLAQDPADVNPAEQLTGHVVVLVPRVLEEALPMLKKTMQTGTMPAVIVAMHLSKLALRREGRINTNTGRYERCVARFWFQLSEFLQAYRERLLIVDHEATLGKKNSALIKRLFQEQHHNDLDDAPFK